MKEQRSQVLQKYKRLLKIEKILVFKNLVSNRRPRQHISFFLTTYLWISLLGDVQKNWTYISIFLKFPQRAHFNPVPLSKATQHNITTNDDKTCNTNMCVRSIYLSYMKCAKWMWHKFPEKFIHSFCCCCAFLRLTFVFSCRTFYSHIYFMFPCNLLLLLLFFFAQYY